MLFYAGGVDASDLCSRNVPGLPYLLLHRKKKGIGTSL